jgi:crossover junction endodeoxyribonuclease RusA
VPRAEFVVAGHAAPKGSRKHFKNGGSVEMSKRCGPWVERVAYASAATGLGTLEPPYEVELRFSMPEKKKPTYAWPVSDGDLDKLVRAVLDGMQQGKLIVDDKHVTKIITEKKFGTPYVAVIVL